MQNEELTPHAKLKSIRELGSDETDKKITFFIPDYQRGFRWSRQQIRDLYLDLYEFTKNKNTQKYCLQPIVVEKNNKWENCYTVIDGQQRLTALFLLGAVYRCSYYGNRKKPLNTFTNYELQFEGKDKFQEFLKQVGQLTFPDTIESHLDEWKEQYHDIDSQNVINILRHLVDEEPYDALHSLYEKLNYEPEEKDVCVIWHELRSSNEDDNSNNAIEVFANINANKIPLTDAELIKAVMLQAYGRMKDDGPNGDGNTNSTVASIRESSFANQWEDVERGLNDNAFWSFFIRDTGAYKTRIDLLFEIWLKNEGLTLPNGDHGLYRAVYEQISTGEKDVKKIWDGIIKIYETLQDWYNDYFIYHMVGCMSSMKNTAGEEAKTNAGFVNALFREYTDTQKTKSKAEFKEYLKKNLGKGLARGIINDRGQDDIESALGKIKDLTYSDQATKDVLLVFNIALLLNSFSICKKNDCERFPFDYYKNTAIEVEHVNPRHPDNTEKNGPIDWAKKMKPILADNKNERDTNNSNLIREQIEQIEKGEDIRKLSDEQIEQIEGAAEINSIGNLTLLDKKLNNDLSNDSFLEKRNNVIRAMLGKEKQKNDMVGEKYYEESVLFPGARWVFMREWLTDEKLSENFSKDIWSKKERELYVNQVIDSLSLLLNGGTTNGNS